MPIWDLLIKINSLKKSEKLNPQQIKALQLKRFRKLLKHTLRKSKFYRDYYISHGIKINSIDEITPESLPPINKKILMDNYDDLVCDPSLKRKDLEAFIIDPLNLDKKYKNIYQVIHTSGSTGTLGIFVYGPDDWNLLRALVLSRISKMLNPFKKTKFAFIGVVDGHYAGISLVKDAPKFLYKLLLISINMPLKHIIQKVNVFNPDIISGYSSGIYLLAQEQLKGNINIKPKRILCSADPLTLEMAEVINKAFSVYPINFYAASESIGMGVQCEYHRGIHLFNDWHYFEVVDKEFRSVNPGESGRLVMTELYNYTQPLIRYQMNDEVILDDKPCQCGCPFPVIREFAGRNEDYLWFKKNGSEEDFIHPGLIIELFSPGLEKLQVVQTEKNRLLMKVIVSQNKDIVIPRINKRMDKILEDKGLKEFVSFDTIVVDEIENDATTGKYKVIIPFKDRVRI
ncbi:MAG: hypothetical protein ABIH18_08055 [Candidatus Omnitrophota bacterium]